MTKKMKKTEKVFMDDVFTMIAPGTPLRMALNRIQEASLGALVVLGNAKELKNVMGGGFELNTESTPQKIYELAKMDGAIILSEEAKFIYGANVQLQPNFNIKTDESGTRHQTAHRIAQQTNKLVIAVSERRRKITAYKGKNRYILHDIDELLSKSSQAIMALEKYALSIETSLGNLSIAEFDGMVTIYDVIEVTRMYGLLFKMSTEVNDYISELGTEGRLVSIQYEEIMLNQEENFEDLIKDYKVTNENASTLINKIKSLDKEELLQNDTLIQILGYNIDETNLDDIVKARGYRQLRNINKVTSKDIELLINEFKELQSMLLTKVEDISAIRGISKFKAEYISKALLRLKNKIILDRY